MTAFKLSWIINEEAAGKNIKDFISEMNISRRALTEIKFAGGKITVNGIEKTVRYVLNYKDFLEVTFPEERINETLVGDDIPLHINYEDDYFLIIEKPAFMSTIPSREHPTGSVAHALTTYYRRTRIRAAIHIVTRLDRDTSGLILVAKHRHVHHLFGLMQREQQIHRKYDALASGIFTEHLGEIVAPIGRKPSSIIEREVRVDGKHAVTLYEVKQQQKNYAHVKLELKTGRTHQIRVHLAHIGHPLLGDEMYGGPLNEIQRQALHCSELHFTHPIEKRTMSFYSPLPDDMGHLLKKE